MSRLLLNLSAALQSLREQKSRAWLSSLGITVGSLAIVLLVSIAVGVQADVGREVEGIGVNVLIVIPGRIEEDSMMYGGMLGISQLAEEDVAKIARVPGVRKAIPLTFLGMGLGAAEKRSGLTLVVGTKPDWFEIRKTKLREGRALTSMDADRPVMVLGSVVADRLFPGRSALGEQVETGGRKFEVVGVTSDPASSTSPLSQGGFENMAFVPYELVTKQEKAAQIDRIFIQTAPDREPKALVGAVEAVLAERLPKESYSVLTQQDLLKLVFKVMSILTTLLTGLTSIALVVGGVGIMTVMLMSVQERAKEIGIRKTVGARRSDIFVQFLGEAVALSLAGGLAGLLLSSAVSAGLAQWTAIKPALTPAIVGLALGVCLVVGCVFGLIPAVRASRRSPVEALRWE